MGYFRYADIEKTIIEVSPSANGRDMVETLSLDRTKSYAMSRKTNVSHDTRGILRGILSVDRR